MTDGSKRQRLQRKLDEHGFVQSQRYADRDGETLVTFYGKAGEVALGLQMQSVSGTFYRVSAHDLPVQPGDPALAGGRFHRKGDPTPLYASSSLGAAVSEITKHLVLARYELPVKWRVTRLEVNDLRVAVVAPDRAEGRQADREHAMAAAASGVEGLLVRSAADEGAHALVVFAHALRKVNTTRSESLVEVTEDCEDHVTLGFHMQDVPEADAERELEVVSEIMSRLGPPELEPGPEPELSAEPEDPESELEKVLSLLSGSHVRG